MWLLAQIRLGKGSGKLNWKGAVLLVSLRPQSTPYIYIGQRQKFKNIYLYICGSNLINLCIFFRKSLGSLRQLPQECLILYRNYKTNEVAKQLQTGTVCLHIRQSWDRGWLKTFIIYGTEAFLKSCFYGSHKLLSKQLQEPIDAVLILVNGQNIFAVVGKTSNQTKSYPDIQDGEEIKRKSRCNRSCRIRLNFHSYIFSVHTLIPQASFFINFTELLGGEGLVFFLCSVSQKLIKENNKSMKKEHRNLWIIL